MANETVFIHPSAKPIEDFSFINSSGKPYYIRFWHGPTGIAKLHGYTTGIEGRDAGDLIARVSQIYKGQVNLGDLTEEERDLGIRDMKLTKLATPLEMIDATFFLSGVSRAFTHQLVRYRIGTAFAQQSLRVAASLDTYHILVGPSIVEERDVEIYMESCIKSIQTFEKLKHIKEFTEDARGVLPHGLLTTVWFKCSLKALGNIVATRLCCQAQPGEWQPIVFQMRNEIAKYMGADVESFLRAPIELNKDCGFHSSTDKPCRWRGKDMRDISKAEWGIEVEDTRSARM